jgi:hypothetical protein
MHDPQPGAIVAAEPFRRHLAELIELRRRLPADASPALRRRVTLAIQVASSPTCPESQPDGVPCGGSTSSCDHCARAVEFMETVRAEIDEALQEEAAKAEDQEPELGPI